MRETPWPIRVEVADPAMPSLGNGPTPAISSGFSAMSMTMASAMNQNGVVESPVPRCAICRNMKKYMKGAAAKTIRR